MFLYYSYIFIFFSQHLYVIRIIIYLDANLKSTAVMLATKHITLLI